MKYRKLACALAFLLASFIPQLQAQFYDWLGTTSNDWSDSSNWQDGATLGASDTARIYNSLTSSDPTPNNTVLKTGASVTLTRVWLGNSNESTEFGVLTVESGAALATSGDFVMENSSTLTSSGDISVGNVNGLIVRDTSVVTLNDGSSLNALRLENFSTATMEAGSVVNSINLGQDAQLTMGSSYNSTLDVNSRSSATINGTINGDLNYNTSGTGLIGENGIVTGNLGVNRSASVTVNGTVQGRININQTSSVTLNGTCVGDFKHNSTEMSYINENAIVQGDATFDNDDKVTIGGNINGAGNTFHIKGSAQVTILPTANILSDNNNSWIYDTPTVTWKVGADGSVATLKTSRNEANAGQFDGEWRYANSEVVLVVDLTDCVVYGTNITLQLVSAIQSEETFSNKVTFVYNGEAVTGFTWDGAGTGSFTGVLANPAPDADEDGISDDDEIANGTDPNSNDTDGDGLLDGSETNTGTYVSATNTGTSPILQDSDSDGLRDDYETATGVYVSATDTGTDPNVADSDIDGMSDYLEVQYLGLNPNVGNSTLISELPSTGGGLTEQDLIDLRVGSKLASIANDQATLQVIIEQSTDLGSWSTLQTEDVIVDAPAGTDKQFFRYRMQD